MRKLLLGKSQGAPHSFELSDQVVSFREGIVPQKGDNPRKAMHHRLNFVAFPVIDRCLIHANPFSYLLLEQAEVEASFSDAIS